MNRVFAFFFLFAFVSCLQAQADLVVFPTGDAKWTVALTALHPASGGVSVGSRQLQTVEVTQANNYRCTRFMFSDGTDSEEWSVPNLPVIFKQYPNGSVFPIQSGSMEAQAGSIGTPSDLSAFTWITPQSLVEKDPVSYQEQLCYHYVGSADASAAILHGTVVKDKREAWIDSKTLLPVALDTGTLHCVFVFSPPPAGGLQIPPKFKQEIAYYKHVMGFP